jgi:sulfur-oxidizing protein SoxA
MMRMKFAITGAAIAALFAFGPAAQADESAELVLNGEIEMTVRAPAPAHMENMSEILSGWVYRKDETQQTQSDDFENPAMLFVDMGLDLWTKVEGSEDKSCASCHDGPEEMAGVSATYPKWNDATEEVRTITMQVNGCRTEQMGAEPWKIDKSNMLNMTALLASVSRGMPVNVAIDGPAQSMWEQGKELYYARTGQLELSCANCHEDNYGNNIRADHLSQGQINGFPAFRLKNDGLVQTHNRFKGCIRDTRAETYSSGSAEFVALELYVASRGNGLSVEAPSVRP